MAETVEAFLAEHELSRYAEAFDEHGWDSLIALRNISDTHLVQLESSVAMKIGHRSRLRAALGKAAAPPVPSAPSAPSAPPPVPDEAGAGAAATVEPPVHAVGGADAAAAAATAGAAALQKQLHDKLTKTDMLGAGLMHGTTIETYQAPAELGGALMIAMTADNQFYCLCCPIPQHLAATVGARPAGSSLCNVISHMGTKDHWTNFRRVVFNKEFDNAEWLRYTGGNKHGPDRARRTKQGKDRAAAAELKREHKKPRDDVHLVKKQTGGAIGGVMKRSAELANTRRYLEHGKEALKGTTKVRKLDGNANLKRNVRGIYCGRNITNKML